MILNWQQFKTILDTRRFRLHSFDRTTFYSLYATDGKQSFFCTLVKATPASDEQSEFEVTYLSRVTTNKFDYQATVKSVTFISQNASVGAANLRGRSVLYLENKGSVPIFYGPTGTDIATGMATLYPGQYVSLTIDDMNSVDIKTSSATGSIIIQEIM